MLISVCLLPPIPLNRSLKSGQVDRYQVESTWKGSERATYAYNLVLTTEKYGKARPEQVRVGFRALDLVMTRNEEKMPPVKLAGAFSTLFGLSGGPEGISVAGPAAIIGLPILCWYLPPSTAGGSQFDIAPVRLAEPMSAGGTGRWVKVKDGRATIQLNYLLGSESASASAAIKVNAIVNFVFKTGRVLSASGTVVDPQGTMTFAIREQTSR